MANLLLLMNYTLIFIGSILSNVTSNYYFMNNGKSMWVFTFIQSAGFPFLLLPLYLPFLLNFTKRRPFTGFTPHLLLISTAVGVLLGANNMLFTWGNAYLPVSTFSLLISSQLAFVLLLSVLLVNQKVNFLNLSCVVSLTLSSILLALNSTHGKPPGLTEAEYWVGFFSALGAGFLFAIYLPVMEIVYRKVPCYAMVVEMQLVMEMAATAFVATVMANDMGVESRTFDKGPVAYWMTIGSSLVVWQLCFMGTAGMVFMTTSLTTGICMNAVMVLSAAGGIVIYGDELGGVKAVAAALSVWGICSCLYAQKMEAENDRLIPL